MKCIILSHYYLGNLIWILSPYFLCFPFLIVRCAADLTHRRQHLRHTCVKTNKTDLYGYTMIGSCPSDNSEKRLETLCTATSSSFDLPVFDLDDKSAYKNIFCAKCNHAGKPVYWKFSASCKGRLVPSDIPRRRTLMLEFIRKNCDWEFSVPPVNSNPRNCLGVKVQCEQSEPYNSLLLSSLCSFYVFPVRGSFQRKNPHCEVCRGNDISAYFCGRYYGKKPTSGPSPGIPSLDILFDFSSASHSVKIGNKKTIVQNKECDNGFLFDPFTDQCVKVLTVAHSRKNNESFFRDTCLGTSFVKIDLSSVTILPNGSIWIPLHRRTYSNESYFVNGSTVFLCVNYTRKFNETTMILKVANLSGRQILTYVGCAISMASLILLFGVYITLAELRTLPGKNLMSLSASMLFYHTVFLMSGQTNLPHLCMVVSILLHFFLLSSFCWMSVMAFDVAKTFTNKGI